MILEDCNKMINAYINWLKEKISIKKINEVCEITTPFLDRHNDYLQIYVKKSNGKIILTDDGQIIRDLKLSGLESFTKRREKILFSILNGFGIDRKGDELLVEAIPEEFPQKKHNLIQAMLSINDLFVLASPFVVSLFKEDVEAFLRLNKIRYTPSVKFTGKSGYDHLYDFVIPASSTKPERVLKSINRPSRESIIPLIFSWNDVREVRPIESMSYGILNNNEREVPPSIINALKSYKINPLLWSQRDNYVEELSE